MRLIRGYFVTSATGTELCDAILSDALQADSNIGHAKDVEKGGDPAGDAGEDDTFQPVGPAGEVKDHSRGSFQGPYGQIESRRNRVSFSPKLDLHLSDSCASTKYSGTSE